MKPLASTPAPVVAPTRPAARLTLLAHVDATPDDLQAPEMYEIESFEGARRDDTHVIVQVRRDGASPAVKIASGLASVAGSLMAAAPAVGAGLGILGSAPVAAGLVLAGTVVVAGSLAWHGVQRVLAGVSDMGDTREPMWHATRTYQVGDDIQPGRLDSPLLREEPGTEASVPGLARFLADGMRSLPAQVTAVMVGGHGLAYDGCAGFSVDELRQALDTASAEAGRKPDLLILESCLMGSLEAMVGLRGAARYAIVSEETMGAYGLPWNEILASLPPGDLTPEALGRAIIEGGGKSSQIDTLALVDLEKMPEVERRFEALASRLREVVAGGGRDDVRDALQESARFPKGTGWLEPDLRDVSQFAQSVREHVSDRAALEATRELEEALAQAVVVGTTSQPYAGAGHLSVQGQGIKLTRESYDSATGFTEWSALLDDMRPWYSRFFHVG